MSRNKVWNMSNSRIWVKTWSNTSFIENRNELFWLCNKVVSHLKKARAGPSIDCLGIYPFFLTFQVFEICFQRIPKWFSEFHWNLLKPSWFFVFLVDWLVCFGVFILSPFPPALICWSYFCKAISPYLVVPVECSFSLHFTYFCQFLHLLLSAAEWFFFFLNQVISSVPKTPEEDMYTSHPRKQRRRI